MQSVNNKILVSCDIEQKNFINIGDVSIKIGRIYETNFREKSPVIAIAKETNGEINKGDILICHHNHFYGESPYWLKDDLFSIPCNKTIFAIIDKHGNPCSVNGNIIGQKIYIDDGIEVPDEYKKYHKDRVRVISNRFGYFENDLIFTRPHAPYEIVYVFNSIEKRIVKVDSEMVVGVLREGAK